MPASTHSITRSIHLILTALIAVLLSAVPAQSAYAADTEIAHIWRFAYQQNLGQGILDIMIIEHEKGSHDILQILDQFTYTVPCTQGGGSISCDLDIKSAVQDSFYQMDLKDEAAKVRAGESYRWMVTETTGRWSTLTAQSHYLLASHPSLTLVVDTNAAGSAFRYRSMWDSHTATSNYYKPQPGQTMTLVNEFDCPTVGPCSAENYVLVAGVRKNLGSQQLSSSATVGFQLAPAQIVITPPAGFQLESFVIDPPKAGYG